MNRAMILICLVAGCGEIAPEAKTVDVWTSLRSVQCAPGSGMSLERLNARLMDAGVRAIWNPRQGADGMMRPAVCGAGDGRVGIFTIHAADLDRARGAGFAPVDELPG